VNTSRLQLNYLEEEEEEDVPGHNINIENGSTQALTPLPGEAGLSDN
jgi:hypothetical protein